MPNLTTPTVRDYLHDLNRALRDLPRARRTEIVRDISAHIDAALADPAEQSQGTTATILDHLGTPAEVADAARAELPPLPARMAGRDIATIVLLLIGGIVIPVLGWLIGAVLLWTSTAWRAKDKLIATLFVPGGLLTPLLLLAVPVSTGGCLTQTAVGPVPVHSPSAGGLSGRSTAVVHTCTTGSGHGAGATVLTIAVLIITVAGPLFSAWWLTRHAGRHA